MAEQVECFREFRSEQGVDQQIPGRRTDKKNVSSGSGD